MKKIYILDTNVLLHDPESLFAFEDNSIVLPLSVIEELDRTKRRGDEVGRNARDASRKLDELRLTGRLAEGVKLPGGGSIRIEINGIKTYDLLNGVDLNIADNRILALAYHLKNSGNSPLVLGQIVINKQLENQGSLSHFGFSVEVAPSSIVSRYISSPHCCRPCICYYIFNKIIYLGVKTIFFSISRVMALLKGGRTWRTSRSSYPGRASSVWP